MYKKLLLISTLFLSISTHTSESPAAPQETEQGTISSACFACKETAQKVGRKLIGHCPQCGNRVEDSLPQKAKHAAKSAYKKGKKLATAIASKTKAFFTSSCPECADEK